jgi:hypothetical protein
MVFSTTEHYTKYGLLVARDPVKLRDISDQMGVEVDPPDSPVKPLVITTKESYDYEGVKSGDRSVLLIVNGLVLKIKGCNVEAALQIDGPYRETYRNQNDAQGGELKVYADNEIQRTNDFNERLNRGGFPVVHEPVATVHYGKKFLPEYFPRLASKVIPLLKASDHMNELVASVMNVKGDTRLSEIYEQRMLDYKTALEVTYRFGVTAGAQKKVTDEFYWKGSPNLPNYVVFVEDGQVHLGMVDFGKTTRYDNIKFKSLNGFRHRTEINKIVDSMYTRAIANRSMHLHEGPQAIRDAFLRGFMLGYQNPEKRKSISLEMLLEAIDLNRG